jgi:hypothetical protein
MKTKVNYDDIVDVLEFDNNDEFRVKGKSVFAAEPEEKTGNKGTFYTQYIFLKDDSCGDDDVLKPSVIIGSTNNEIQKGDIVEIHGTVKKRGKKKYYNAKLVNAKADNEKPAEKTEQEKQTSNNSNGYKNGNGSKDGYWEKKFQWEQEIWKFNRAGMSRSNGVQFAVNFMKILVDNKIIEFAGDEEAEIILWRYIKATDLEILHKEEDNNGKTHEEGNTDFDFGENKTVTSKS